MPSRKGQPNDPNRRVAPPDSVSRETLDKLGQARYTGVCYHKSRHSPEYGFAPCPRPVNRFATTCVQYPSWRQPGFFAPAYGLVW